MKSNSRYVSAGHYFGVPYKISSVTLLKVNSYSSLDQHNAAAGALRIKLHLNLGGGWIRTRINYKLFFRSTKVFQPKANCTK